MRDFQMPGRSPVFATEAMAATSHPLATEAAIATLRAGGTAADAAVAACAVLCVVEPHMVSPAGDAFWIVGKPGKPLEGYNGSGRSGKAASLGWFVEKGYRTIPEGDIHAVTVPGALDAWDALLARHGRFGLDRVLQRAIEVAERGHAVAPRVALDWGTYAHHGAADPGFAKHYLPGGAPPRAGDVVRQPALAATFRTLAAKGARAMYEGEIADDVAATLKAKGSFVTRDDLAAHAGEVVDPITFDYRGHHVAEIPPNGQGLTAHVILGVMRELDSHRHGLLSAERYHALLEATRLGYAARDAHIAERAAMGVKPEALVSPGFLAALAAKVSDARAIDPATLALPPPETNTIYLSVVDRDGTAVSFICSIFRQFGVGVVTEKTGLILQNRGSAFRVVPGHPNAIGPSKRPLHTIIPGMVTREGRVLASFGVMGGAYQACGHAHVLTAMFDHGLDPQAALDLPRAFFEGPLTTVERALPAPILEGLARRGHKVMVPHGAIGGGQVIAIDHARGVLVGGSDFRKDGTALGW
jgi:gamma-glutamyltranspeptidase/glutathione hydrolase